MSTENIQVSKPKKQKKKQKKQEVLNKPYIR